ncbi:MAG TPA: hypothetical protein DCY51_03140 [Bacteroidetes bacterium]|nr:hypothetical protein [Bacteroidota bacterium]
MSKLITLPIDLNPITKATYFLAPLVGIDSAIIRGRFVNAYVGAEVVPDVKGPHVVIMVYNYQDRKRGLTYEKFVDSVTSLDTFVGTADICCDRIGMYIMSIPEQYHEEFILFRKGRYSEYSLGAKILCSKNYMLNNDMYKLKPGASSNIIDKIFRKDDTLHTYWEKRLQMSIPRGQEVWSKPVKKDELFTSIREVEWEKHLCDAFTRLKKERYETLVNKKVLGGETGEPVD